MRRSDLSHWSGLENSDVNPSAGTTYSCTAMFCLYSLEIFLVQYFKLIAREDEWCEFDSIGNSLIVIRMTHLFQLELSEIKN